MQHRQGAKGSVLLPATGLQECVIHRCRLCHALRCTYPHVYADVMRAGGAGYRADMADRCQKLASDPMSEGLVVHAKSRRELHCCVGLSSDMPSTEGVNITISTICSYFDC